MAVNSYYSRKLHSLLGVVPLGFFLIEHFFDELRSVSRRARKVSGKN